MTARRARVAVAVSGGGRTLQNLLAHARAGAAYEVAAVIASRIDCGGVVIAAGERLPLFVDPFRGDKSAQAKTAEDLDAWLAQHDVDWVALAGFLRPFPVLRRYEGRVVNIHPALLPRFGGQGMYGHRVHAAVLAAGEPVSGASMHFVTERYDEGRVIAQIEVPVRAGDDADALAARVFAAETVLYPRVLEALVVGTLPRADGGVERWQHDV
jgi:folate-dependent phosphoribosylglycinamide formyltransferase PurN